MEAAAKVYNKKINFNRTLWKLKLLFFRFHIASCAMVLDYSINIWDVRRPYIPFASFNEHRDVVKGIAWKGDPHVFLSTSKV